MLTIRGLLFLSLLCSGCGGEDKAYHAYGTYHIDGPAKDLISEAGEPTLERQVIRTDSYDTCNRESDRVAVRALEYHLPMRGFSHYLRKLLRSGPSMIIIVCVDSSGVVTDIEGVVH